MNGSSRYILAGTCFVLGLGTGASAALSDPLQVTGGLVAGVTATDANISVFKGIPYAAPPTGELRWKLPAAVPSWDGTRQANRHGSDCTYPGQSAAQGSEDCLYLNLWTGAKTKEEGRSVAVFLTGTGTPQDGEPLAQQGIVVVTATFRNGLMGFLAHPDLTEESERKTSGNYGLLDQIAVLEWVNRNIAAFGGDAKRVTVVGPYAALLAGSPLSKGLLASAIPTSDPNPMPLPEAEKAGDTFAQAENAHSLRFLRPMDAGVLVQATVEDHYQPGPVVDGWVVKADWRTASARGIRLMPVTDSPNPAKPESRWLNFIRTGDVTAK